MNSIDDTAIGTIDTGISVSKRKLDSSAMLIKNSASNLNKLITAISRTETLIREKLYEHHLHVHNFHKHISCVGHCGNKLIRSISLKSGVVDNSGKFFANGQIPTIVSMLLQEMAFEKDFDGNGKCFFHDFMIHWDDPSLPPAIKQLVGNPYMPGNMMHPYVDPEYIIKLNEYLIDYYDNNNSRLTKRIPRLIKRRQPCKFISWNEYYSEVSHLNTKYPVI